MILKPRIVFFSPGWPALAHGVIHSQVLSVARFLSENGFDCMFVGCERSEGNADRAVDKILDVYGIRSVVYSSDFSTSGYLSILLRARNVFHRSKEEVIKFNPSHIYSRSIIDSPYARKMASISNSISVLDVRGVVSEEGRLKRGKRDWRYWLVRSIEKREFKKSDCLSCVSDNLKRYILSVSKKNVETIIPSCFDEMKFSFDYKKRILVRRDLGLSDEDILICYSGGMSAWQRVPDIIDLFVCLSKINNNYKFIFLTKDKCFLNQLLISSDLSSEDYFVFSCDHSEVSQYLSASDAGIVMRDDVLVNNVASPIKIGEYMGCGLPLILTHGIGDYSQFVRKSNIGLLLNEDSDLARQVDSFMNGLGESRVVLRKRVVKYGRDNFTLKPQLEKYRILYRG